MRIRAPKIIFWLSDPLIGEPYQQNPYFWVLFTWLHN